MRHAILALALIVLSGQAGASARLHLPQRPSLAGLLAAGPIHPGGTLVVDGPRLRTLELDELAPLRLRLTIPF